ncbi:hypothetical protein F4692_003165 [Nocardioides cavernae]|uniref:RNA polymerase sigma-70 domain-containing protein n=1 Tax=Nocardioides cavernae TaxID=1921566 RepID=A0A7Y9KSZ0_9ACTN|nr:sigma factor-like helix-turn-helix DNA-binding protein [Nocardioides cavernae]NYE38020.1 hypothetical protein [Nocardioides cavernae]
MNGETDDMQPESRVDRLAELSLDSPELSPFRQSIREWTLFELLKADGFTTVGSVASLSRSELCDVPNIGEQSVDEVAELLDRIRTALRWDDPAPSSHLPVVDFDWEPQPLSPAGWDVVEERPKPKWQDLGGRAKVGDAPASPNTLGSEFPGLTLLAGRSLSDPLLKAAWVEPGDGLAHSWLARTGAALIGDLLALTRQDLLHLRGLGPSKVRRLYDYLGRLAGAAPTIVAWDDVAATPAPDTPSADSRRHAILEMVVAWASSVAGATTWGEALMVSAEAMPADVAGAWQELLAMDLPALVERSPLAEFLADDPRRSRVLIDRVASSEPLTLQELATEFGVTRERMRQIESKSLERLRSNFDSSPTWRVVRWAAERVVAQAGAYAPSDVLARALPRWSPAERHLVARLAGYERSDPALVREGLKLPNVAELPTMADTDFVVDEYEVVERLHALGVLEQHVEFALSSVTGVSRVDGQLVRWSGSVVDKAVAVLEIRDEPQNIDQLVSAAYGEGGSRSARNRIFEDPRLMRVTKNKVGLRRWGGVRYSGVAELMLDRLASGPMDLDELADELAERYEIASASVRMYAAAPAFKVTGDTIALRSRREPYVPRHKPWKVRGLYRQSDVRTTVWCTAVDNDMLRGSGRSIPQEIASDLGLRPGDRTELTTAAGLIPVAWSETTHSGPHIGSIRELLEDSGASVGDQLALRFNLADCGLEVRVIRPPTQDDVVEELARLTTLPKSLVAHRTRLAAAVGIAPADLVPALEARGDGEVASLVARLPLQAGGVHDHDADQTSNMAAGGGAAVSADRHPPRVDTPNRDSVAPNRGGRGATDLEREADSTSTALASDPDQATLEREYERAVANAMMQMRSIGYDEAALRKLVATVGSRRASELIADLAEPTAAFVALHRLGRLDLSIEAQMSSRPYRGLFESRHLSRITRRLQEHGFKVDL